MSQMVPEPGLEVAFTRWLENLRVDLSESFQGVVLRGARPVPVNGQHNRPTNSPGALVGYALRNLSYEDAAVVRVLFRDGTDDTGEVILPLTLEPGESARDWFGPGGINLAYGLFLSIDGDVEGSVFLRGTD